MNKREVVEGSRKKHEPISPAGLVRPLPGGGWYPFDGSLIVGVSPGLGSLKTQNPTIAADETEEAGDYA